MSVKKEHPRSGTFTTGLFVRSSNARRLVRSSNFGRPGAGRLWGLRDAPGRARPRISPAAHRFSGRSGRSLFAFDAERQFLDDEPIRPRVSGISVDERSLPGGWHAVGLDCAPARNPVASEAVRIGYFPSIEIERRFRAQIEGVSLRRRRRSRRKSLRNLKSRREQFEMRRHAESWIWLDR